MKSSAIPAALLLALAAVSTVSAHEIESFPHVHPHPDWSLAFGAIAVIAGVAGIVLLARRATAEAKGHRS